MRRLATTIVATALLAIAGGALAAPAQAQFGFSSFDVTYAQADGSPAAQAGSHPFSQTTSFRFNTVEHPTLGTIPAEAVRDQVIFQVPGFVGDPTVMPACEAADFLVGPQPLCDDSTAVGHVAVHLAHSNSFPVYNLEPAPGSAAKLGFSVTGTPVAVDVGVSPLPPYEVVATLRNTSQVLHVGGADFTLWGVPADPAHDPERGICLTTSASCAAAGAPEPFLTMPRSCKGPLPTRYELLSWEGSTDSGQALTHDGAGSPLGMLGCERLGFGPEIAARPTTRSAETPSGLAFTLELENPGLTSAEGIADSDLAEATVALPAGVTVNPSAAEGLGVCTPAQLEAETLRSAFGSGCPGASRLGSVEVETPLLDERLRGDLFQAQPDDPSTPQPGAENPFDSLLAIYLVIREPQRGIIVKLAGEVTPDPATGRIVTTFSDLPELPFSKFTLRFREGARAPLVTPPACGTYEVVGEFAPHAAPDQPITASSSFEITSGVGDGPCPAGGTPPWNPGFSAGTTSNAAASYSPFLMRMTRRDGEQSLTTFAADLPIGLIGKLAGISQCSDAALAAAEGRTGKAEKASPSCPANSRIGSVNVGAGVGSVLTYVPGTVYLAGPYKGAPLSVAVITPAVAGPFDVGVVLTRLGLNLDPQTGEVSVDADASDPIPHILEGIPLKIRDLRVHMDRQDFIRNPTSCDPMEIVAKVTGSGQNVFDPSDDVLRLVPQRFQAANCLNLGFAPKFAFEATGRGATLPNRRPGITSTVEFNPDETAEANIKRASVVLPPRMIIDQENIATTCTRAQFAQGACPDETRIGEAIAHSQLLDDPLQGPVYLIASDNPLPDLVADLRGIVDIQFFGRIHSQGIRIRNTFDVVPDAPVESFRLSLEGGRDGIVINGADLCNRPRLRRIDIEVEGHNLMRADQRVLFQNARCDRIQARKLARRVKNLRQQARKAARNGNRARAKKLRQRANRLQNRARNIRDRS